MTIVGRAQPEEVALQPAMPRAPASGVRSGAMLAVASGAGIVLNYAFLLAAGRILGSDRYGSLGALLGLLAVVLIPAGAVQMAVSREVSRLVAADRSDEADAFARGAVRLAALATVPLLVVALALAVPLAHLLHIHSSGVVALAEFAFITSLLFPAAMGVLQGRQRFHALAVMYVFPFVVRLVLLAIVAGAGFKLGGTVFATVLATIAACAFALVLIADSLRRGAKVSPPNLRPFLRYLGPVGIGLVAIALLTHVDILVVKARFSANDAGAYAAASAFARVAFFLPATILAVLFPRTAARQARGEETEDILGRSLIATVVFCGALAVFYLATGPGLVTASFGRDFAEGGHILAPFAIAIGLYSLAQILVGYHLSRGETRYAWIVAGGVLLQLFALSVIPSTLDAFVWTNVVVAAGLIAAHEVFAGSSVPALRAGLRHLRGAGVGIRTHLAEGAAIVFTTTAFVCAFFWPLVTHLGSTILGFIGSDATATVAGFWDLRHEGGYHVLGITHHTFSGAPFGWDESNALNTQVLLAYYPTYLMSRVIGDIAAYNLTTLSGYVLSGVAMYVLARYLRCSPLVSAWAALVFIVFPFHIAHEEHASLVHLEVLALLLLSLVAVAQRPSSLRFGLVGAANLACWLMSGYFGPMATITTVAFTAAVAVRRRRDRLKLVAGSISAAVVAAGVLGVVAVASGTNSGAGLHRAVGDLSIFGVRPADLLVPPAGNILIGGRLHSFWTTHTHGANPTEVINYVGWLTIVLALAWIVVAWRRWSSLHERQRTATVGLAATLVAGLVFAAPSPLGVFGHNIPMPARLVFAIVPAFRVLSRWNFLLMAALTPLAALGLQLVWSALVKRRVALAVGVTGLAMVVSFLELTIRPAQQRFRTTPAPPEYTAVNETPYGILADYPLGYSDVFRLWQRVHGHPLLNGAPPNTPADTGRLMLLDPTQPGTAEALALLGVTAIGIHPGAHVDAEVLPGNPTRAEGYRLVGRFPDGASVWDVVAPAAPAFVTLAGFDKPMREANGLVVYPLIASSGVGAMEIAAKTPSTVRLVFEAKPPNGTAKVLRVDDTSHEQAVTLHGWTRISVVVSVPRGQSQLLLKTDPPPTSLADAIVISAPRAQPATGTPAFQAQLLSPNPGF